MNCSFEEKAFESQFFDLFYADFGCDAGLADVDREDETRSSNLRGAVAQEVGVSLHVAAVLSCQFLNLISMSISCLVLVNAEYSQVPFEEGNSRNMMT